MAGEDRVSELVDKAVAEGGAYDIIRRRLVEQGDKLENKVNELNLARQQEFGSTEMAVVASTRVRTENNCVGRDIVQVGDLLAFGYNVFIGLKKTTRIEDVFSLYRLTVDGDKHQIQAVPIEGSFLSERRFQSDFDELYRYYSETRLVQLVLRDGKLLAGFQIGDRLDDIRVFRWAVSEDGSQVTYIDNRGERDLALPEPYDFEWTWTQREDIVQGRFAHINILDELFIETLGGKLTVKVENNTEDGHGIYSEPVDDETQSLSDAEFAYARLGDLILVKVLPYKEANWRHLVYDTQNKVVRRVDAIASSCIELPEDHGIIFPDGLILASGEYKSFGIDVSGYKFKRKIRSPNGEDVLFVFYEPIKGELALLSYNLITKSLQNPIITNGYALARDGAVIVFSAGDEPTRVHPMQIWETPYCSDEYASSMPASQSFYARIGNPALVRGISDLYSVCRQIREESVSARSYESLRKRGAKLFDDHFWIGDSQLQGIGDQVKEVCQTVELIVDEFEKVESIRRHSEQAMLQAKQDQQQIDTDVQGAQWQTVDEFVGALDRIRRQRGHLATIREYRYIDVDELTHMDNALVEMNTEVSDKTAYFLSGDNALDSYVNDIQKLQSRLQSHTTVAELRPDIEQLDSIAGGLDLLSELIATLKVDDATVQTRIVDSISDVYANLNQTRARSRQHQENMGSAEAVEQFAAQFKLFSQSITNALSLATTPERCEEQLTRLLVQLEELESQFGEHDRFLGDIMEKREEVHDTFASHKQQLLDARQVRAQTLSDAVNRMLDNIERRAQRFEEPDELNTYLASDALVLKVRDIVGQLRALDSTVKADDAESRMKMIQDMALRSLRDRSDLYSDGGQVIALGAQHRFSVNTEDLDLTIIPRVDGLALHLVGTQYFEPLANEQLNSLREYWNLSIESETDTVYRGEYLAYLIIQAARENRDGLDWPALVALSTNEDQILAKVREFATPRYREGYQKGVHDTDAANLLRALVPLIDQADLLRFDPASRGLAQLIWGLATGVESSKSPDADEQVKHLLLRAKSAAQLQSLFGNARAARMVERELHSHFSAFTDGAVNSVDGNTVAQAVTYLTYELGRYPVAFVGSRQSAQLQKQFVESVENDVSGELLQALTDLHQKPAEQWRLASAWLNAYLDNNPSHESLRHYVPESAAGLITADRLARRALDVDMQVTVSGLFGEHQSIVNGELDLSVDTFLNRLNAHCTQVIPGYRRYLSLRHDIAEQAREELRLEEFKARPLSSFVRNKLINEAYLPIIGDNLAKQIGTVGENKRSDLNGLLMMISPPGYGKTTLMEYVASRLGLTFMKINCPALGHDVASLDPATAPNATAAQELQKLNLALEMGDNVMLYLDDIQHTGAEFLQKFISLCDSTRRIEGVWKGRTRTYDMRGRKFCVVMAGNPYTESGEMFKVPDMLANRADIYNLGDVLSGKESQFELSYIENCLTSNSTLAPLATREMSDVYKFVDMARGRNVATTDLSHAYSGAEVSEITKVLQRLLQLQDTVLKVNQQYIASAAQEDKYRVEPRFLLQGSYRNMNKLAEKVSSVMNETELDELIDDHYRGEAQLLTQGTEANLLKLADLRSKLSQKDAARWEEIKTDFLREKAMGGDSSDAGQRIASQLAGLVEGVTELGDTLKSEEGNSKDRSHQTQVAQQISESLDRLGSVVQAHQSNIQITNTPSDEFAQVLRALNDTIEHTLFPLVRTMDARIGQDVEALEQLQRLANDVAKLKRGFSG